MVTAFIVTGPDNVLSPSFGQVPGHNSHLQRLKVVSIILNRLARLLVL